jgi:hypothetical protein
LEKRTLALEIEMLIATAVGASQKTNGNDEIDEVHGAPSRSDCA